MVTIRKSVGCEYRNAPRAKRISSLFAFAMNEGWVLRRTAERRMGFWFFGPVTWRFGGGKGPKGGRVTFFGAFLTLPLMGWNAWQWGQLPDGSSISPPEAPELHGRIDDRDELE